jgi:hypothetical protein
MKFVRMLVSAGKVTVTNARLVTAILAGAVLASSAPGANALTYSTSGSATQFSLGDTLGTASNYDILQVMGVKSGEITPTTTSITLNELIFTAGPNALVPADYNNQFSFTEKITIGTGTGTLVVPFNLSINYSDTLTIVGGTKISIPVGASIWNVVVNGLTIGPNPGGPEIGFLTAQVSDPPGTTPLPAAFLLFGSGLGTMELLRRRKKARAGTVLAA